MTSKVVNSIDLPILHAGGHHGGAGGTQSRVGERLDLVEHVKVRVSVSLGDTEIPIAKLFSLSGGDVLALDRDADAPVDIRVNDRLIARGVLVAVGAPAYLVGAGISVLVSTAAWPVAVLGSVSLGAGLAWAGYRLWRTPAG